MARDLDLIRIEKEKRIRSMAEMPLLDFIPYVTPRYYRPEYLSPLTSALDDICNGIPRRILVSSPPQHGKTETILHFIVKYLLKYREHSIGYVSYEATIAGTKSLQAIRIGERSLFPFGEKVSVSQWETDKAGKVLVTGAGGPLTGHGLNGIIVDDPHKNAQEASSKLLRDRIEAWYASVAETRLAPGGWEIVNMARWHEDDLYGRLKKTGEYDCINIPAINEKGEPLCPARKSIESLLSYKRRNEYFFQALYMGNPRPIGSLVFKEPCYYDELPGGLSISLGLDFNYGKNPRSDYSVIVVMGCDSTGTRYLLEVFRDHLRSDEFEDILRFWDKRWRGSDLGHYLGMHAYASSIEGGVIDLLNSKSGLDIVHLQADTNKYIRALPFSGEWNSGRVLLPSEKYQEEHGKAEWLEPYLGEILSFTGKNDPNDDQIDASSGADYPFSSPGSTGALWA